MSENLLLNLPYYLLGFAALVRVFCLASDAGAAKWQGRPLRFLALVYIYSLSAVTIVCLFFNFDIAPELAVVTIASWVLISWNPFKKKPEYCPMEDKK